jgi:hypothetical protein
MFINMPNQQLYGQLREQHKTKLTKDHKQDTHESNTYKQSNRNLR